MYGKVVALIERLEVRMQWSARLNTSTRCRLGTWSPLSSEKEDYIAKIMSL